MTIGGHVLDTNENDQRIQRSVHSTRTEAHQRHIKYI